MVGTGHGFLDISPLLQLSFLSFCGEMKAVGKKING